MIEGYWERRRRLREEEHKECEDCGHQTNAISYDDKGKKIWLYPDCIDKCFGAVK